MTSSSRITELIDIAVFHNYHGLDLQRQTSIADLKNLFAQSLLRLRIFNENYDESQQMSFPMTTFAQVSFRDCGNRSYFMRYDLENVNAEVDISDLPGFIRVEKDIGVDVHSMSAAVLYNLALAHHVDALISRRMHITSTRKKILRFYGEALFLVEDLPYQSIGTKILAAALYNNMATIHSSYACEDDVSYSMIRELYDIIRWIENEYDSKRNGSNVDGQNIAKLPSDDLRFFRTNVYLAQMLKFSNSPAA